MYKTIAYRRQVHDVVAVVVLLLLSFLLQLKLEA